MSAAGPGEEVRKRLDQMGLEFGRTIGTGDKDLRIL